MQCGQVKVTGKSLGRLILITWIQELALLFLVIGSLWATELFGFDNVAAYSALLGGLIFFLPNTYFALFAFRYRGAQAKYAVLQGFYRGEFGKLLLTAIGFALVFVFFKPLSYPVLFFAYLAMTLCHGLLVSFWI